MAEPEYGSAVKIVIQLSESFAKWLVPWWLIPLLVLAVVFGAGAVTLIERQPLSDPSPPIGESRTVE